MPSSPDRTPPQVLPPQLRTNSAVQLVSDRLAAAMSRRDFATAFSASGSVATANPVEVARSALADPSFAVEAAAPWPRDAEADQPGVEALQNASRPESPASYHALTSPEVAGRFAGTGGLDGPLAGDFFSVASDDPASKPLAGSPGPALASPGPLIAPDLDPPSDRRFTGIESNRGNPIVESPIVRGGMPASVPDYAGTPLAEPGVEGSAPARWSQAILEGDNLGIVGGSGGGNAGTSPGFDLTRTNEILGQILEALRKQMAASGTPLPTAGPSLYAGRL